MANTRTGFTDSYLRHLKSRKKRYDMTDARRGRLAPRVPERREELPIPLYASRADAPRDFRSLPSVPLAEAHFKHAEAERLLDQGKDPAELARETKRAERVAGTVAELAEEFMSRYVKPCRKRPEQMQQMLDSNGLPYWRHKKAKDFIAPRCWKSC